jgi:site-specific recombinase XerD
LQFYENYLTLAREVIGTKVADQQIKSFLDNLTCSNGGRHAYCRALRAFYNWLYSPKSGMSLNPQNNPMLLVDSPKVEKINRLIKVKVKGNRGGLAPFGPRTESLLREWLSQYNPNGTLWDLEAWGIVSVLGRLEAQIGLPCNAHTFRRTFASILAKRGMTAFTS